MSLYRQLLPAGYIECMPTKEVTYEELMELMCHDDYNPTYYYPKEVKRYVDERGYDQCYRYILIPYGSGFLPND